MDNVKNIFSRTPKAQIGDFWKMLLGVPDFNFLKKNRDFLRIFSETPNVD